MSQAQVQHSVTAEMIASRQRLIEDINGFATRILEAQGRIIDEVVHSHHTRLVRELRDWNEFSFCSETGRSQFGGESLKVWYRTRPVLDVTWTDIASCLVLTFSTSGDWQLALAILMKDEAAALAKAAAEKEAKRLAEKAARDERDRIRQAESNFVRDAKRLGFT